jgi:hypothetical protein
MTHFREQPDTVAGSVLAAFEELPRLADEDLDLVRRGRFLTCEFEIGVGTVPLAVSIAQGRIVSVKRGPFLLKPFAFAVRAEPDVWLRFLEPMPAPGFYDLLGMNKVGKIRIEGNLVPFMANLQYVKDLLALPRSLSQSGGRP